MPTTPWPYPRIVCHRGGGALAPENTLAGIRKAGELGFGGVEFDVMLSSDGIPVLIHDETLERTTNGSGAVARTPYAVLARLDAGSRFREDFRGEGIPAFEQAAQVCRTLGIWANVEIKPSAGSEIETGTRAATLAAEVWRDAAHPPLLSSFSLEALAAAGRAAAHLPRGLLTDRIDPGWARTASDLGCVSVHCNCAFLTADLAGEVREAGYWLLCYTVNDSALARRLFSWGVDAVFTDRLDLLTPGFR